MVDAITHGASGFETSEKGSSSSRSSVAPAQTLGSALRQRREAMGVSLAEVEVATRIRQKYLAAIESDDWHLLPGEVVGRGFLRNYSDYLGLDPHEVVDRRRAVTDSGLAAALANTSSGAKLPPERQVDYRPKEVELKDEADGIQRGEIKLTPLLAILALAIIVVLGWWAATRMREPILAVYAGMQSQVERVTARNVPTATPVLIGIVNTQNTSTVDAGSSDSGGTTDVTDPPPPDGGDGSGAGSESEAPAVVLLAPTETPTAPPATDTPTPELPTLESPTPAPEQPTAEPTLAPPTATPTFTVVPPTPVPETPSDTPTPEPPSIVAAVCADGRAVISSPGVNEVVSGVLNISGAASHEALDYYKLEFAPGENASGGFVYFDGRSSPVAGGPLGSIDTRNLANGVYTLRITVVDQTGNFPTPCLVSFIVQN